MTTDLHEKRRKMAEVTLENFIDGEFVPASSFLDSFDPSVGEVWARIPDSGKQEVDLAVAAAKRAFPIWSSKSRVERAKMMNKIADLIEENLEELAQIESRDQGKPVWLARAIDIPRAVHNFRFFASSILHTRNSSTLLEDVGATNYTMRMPIGVAGMISPWNLPLYLLTFKIAPCIAAGNTCVCKPSEMTSVTSWKLAKLMVKAGLPNGVVNMVYGLGHRAGSAIVEHPDVPLVSFTGGTETGKKIMALASPLCKKISLELGGKNAAVVFDDVDLDEIIPTVVRSGFTNQGEICLCMSRFFVQESILEKFVEKYVAAARKMVVGPPSEDSSKLGALISKEHLYKVKGYVELAIEEGGTVHCGEGVDEMHIPLKNKNGYYMAPTVITGLGPHSRCMQEEIFGPVVCIAPFTTEEDAIEKANCVKYGLAACVWTKDVGRTHRVSQKLQAGTVWANCWMVRDLNMPFGGMKASGVGREGVNESMEFFTEAKCICIKH
ncbi:2-aminomuconic semialdehyde dehydrogenase [Strongylocentrotus purpuratus]|uniref:Aldehyde dehydrogenase domain-containing protein n=1 Tax=Strongylocentrotus purpuratus TaxID=7668 RepID=A0A7M7STM2_STRPU|nr:2-aminomuconic semialdehyde dehydrogenase [Strongylocentrotus purpuratus]